MCKYFLLTVSAHSTDVDSEEDNVDDQMDADGEASHNNSSVYEEFEPASESEEGEAFVNDSDSDIDAVSMDAVSMEMFLL